MNTEDSEFERIEREQAMRGVPDAIHHTDTSETLEYIQGWNDCRQAMLAEQPAQQCKWPTCQREEAQKDLPDLIAGALGVSRGTAYDMMREALEKQSRQERWQKIECPICGDMAIATDIPPAQRKPLTEEEIDELSRTMVKGNKSVNWLCRAIEATHGIKENT